MAGSRIEARELQAWIDDVGMPGLLPPRLVAHAEPTRPSPTLLDEVEMSADLTVALLGTAVQTLVVPLVRNGDVTRRALAGDGAFESLADVLRRGAPHGPLTPRPIVEVPPARGERAIDVDQSNESVVVGERLVVKLFPRGAAGSHPGPDAQAHLAALGFEDIPTPHGSIQWERPGGTSVVVASVTTFLPGARDGWDWFLELAIGAIAGGDHEPSRDAAERCGSLVARFHHALATPSPVFGPDPVGVAAAAEAARWRRTAEELLGEALELTHGDAGERLAALAPRIRHEFGAFDDVTATPVQPIHGDLHVGQILAGDHGYAVADLDGNPLASPEDRVATTSPARDVASFVRSLDHLGRIAERRLEGRDREVEVWVEDVRRTFLYAYSEALRSLGAPELFDDRLLRPFEVVQGCHEYVYAARYLPSWLPVADRAMARLVGDRSP